MRLYQILVLVTSLAVIAGKQCIKEAGQNTCSQGGDECDVASGFVCMDISRGSLGNVKSLCGDAIVFAFATGAGHDQLALPANSLTDYDLNCSIFTSQDQGCWCDPSLTSQEACKEGLSCQESNHGQYKCEPSEIFTIQCHSSECAWRMVFHHNPDGSPISGSLDELLDLLKNGAEVKVWTSVYGLVNVQKVSVAYNEDIDKESAHGQSLFWASGGQGRLYNIYLVFSTSGVAHVTQFFVNSPTNAGRINSNVLLEMKWFTRRPAIKVTDKSALYQAIKDGAHIRATVEDSSRHVEVVDITGGEISAVSVYELLDFNRGMEFYPNETRLLRHWSYGGQIQVASGILNQPYWEFEEAQNHNIDWYVDPCWEAVFRHDASGKALFGSKDSLTEGLESGKRVKLRVGDKFYEANVIRQVEGEIAAMVYDSVDVDVTKGQWEWLTVKTSGSVNTVRFIIGGDVIQSEDQQQAEVTWFVENKQWSSVSLETPAELEAHISAGADVRYSVQLNNERVWYQADFALESIMIGQVSKDVYLLYNEREIVHDGTQYLQRYSFLQWRSRTFTYMDYSVGQQQQISYNAVSTTVHVFTNEVVA